MARLFILALVVWMAYFVAKSIWKALFPPPRQTGSHVPTQGSDADLIQDPQCGAFFMKSKGIKGIVDGKVIHFCSEQCYDRYLKRRDS